MSVVNIKKKELNKNGYKDFEDWNANSDHIYIGRNMCAYVPGTIGSKWKNPFSLKYFLKKSISKKNTKYTLKTALEKYEDHVRNTPSLYNSLGELEGKVLGCWCKPSQCHGDILLKLLKEKN